MMRIAGRGEDGTAKAIKTDNEGRLLTQLTSNVVEEVLAESLILTAGQAQLYEIDMSEFASYRILISPNDTTSESASILVRAMADLGHNPEVISHYVPILKTRGNRKMDVGYVTINNSPRNAMWSKPYSPLREKQKIRILHSSDSLVEVADLKIVVLKYTSNINDDNPTGSIVGRAYTSSLEPSGILPSHDSVDNLTYDYPVAIDYIEWQCGHPNVMRLTMEVKINNAWVPIAISLPRTGGSNTHHTPRLIQENKSGFWNILEFDNESETKFFKFSLRSPLPLIAPEGFRIFIKNNSSQNAYMGGIIVIGRRLS